jgi:hypothetical protein
MVSPNVHVPGKQQRWSCSKLPAILGVYSGYFGEAPRQRKWALVRECSFRGQESRDSAKLRDERQTANTATDYRKRATRKRWKDRHAEYPEGRSQCVTCWWLVWARVG